MCTAASYKTRDHYFGRNLDYEYSYHESVTITPRKYPFSFRRTESLVSHYAMIGIAYVVEEYPLYYDAVNERGLGMAGLNFVGYAHYFEEQEDKINIAPFELIPWVLGQCANVQEAKQLLMRTNLLLENFRADLPVSPLHWMISDRESSITVESVETGLKIYENAPGILTNNPPFELQLFNLNNYISLSSEVPKNSFAKNLSLETYSRGMGGLGLPGDLSSMSRFVRAAFTKEHAVSMDSEAESVSQFFHILSSVEQQRGCVHLGKKQYEITIYSSCCNTDQGIYYYKTYDNSRITAVHMRHENLDADRLVSYALRKTQDLYTEN